MEEILETITKGINLLSSPPQTITFSIVQGDWQSQSLVVHTLLDTASVQTSVSMVLVIILHPP